MNCKRVIKLFCNFVKDKNVRQLYPAKTNLNNQLLVSDETDKKIIVYKYNIL